MKESLKPQRKEAEELFDKWTAVMKEATITLSNWDTETEHGVRLIDDTEQKQVSAWLQVSNCLNNFCVWLDFSWVVIIFLLLKDEHVTMSICLE